MIAPHQHDQRRSGAIIPPAASVGHRLAMQVARRCWNGFETFDLFDAPDSSGTNDQIEEAE
ncbi:hypothetical protein ACQKGC_28895 [Allorhizobium pseudoryzae]|uniref:hypothetical protein n=1 Tax=Allorhizobium pseudoryzae TaxID=379684 RepID=UPI003D064DA3